ncbi:MAG: hypothetical protein QXN37_02150 [Candidatus Anstonellaceae archaeon]
MGIEKVTHSANTNIHHNISNSADDFTNAIKMLKEAEKVAAEKVQQAMKEASQIEAQAREKAVEISSRNAEKIVQAKNEILAEGRAKTEREIREIIGEANRYAGRIRAKKLDAQEAKALAAQILEG